MIVENKTTGIFRFATAIGYAANLFLVSFILYIIIGSRLHQPYIIVAIIVIILAMLGKKEKSSLTPKTIKIESIIFGMKISTWLHGIPLTSKLEIGHKNGVGKNADEWVKISKRICKLQASISHTGFLKINQTSRKTAPKIIILCVTL